MVDNSQTQPTVDLPQENNSGWQSRGKGGKRNSPWLLRILILIIAIVAVYFSFTFWNLPAPTYEGTELSGAAPDFQLTDQNGSMISLSDFRGKIVVLAFMDTKCMDTCPITASHFRQVYQQLNSAESEQVVFLGVNVNIGASTVADVYEITQTWRLDEIPTWHFLTGSPADLEQVWQAYGVAVESTHDAQNEKLLHTPGTYIIDPSGQERWYISVPISAKDNAEFDIPLSDLLISHLREILSEIKR